MSPPKTIMQRERERVQDKKDEESGRKPRLNTHGKPATSRAICYASGHVHIVGWSAGVPDGALPLAIGPEKELRDFFNGVCRHSRSDDSIYVPGVPEADAAMDALEKFLEVIRPAAEKLGIEVL